MALLVLGTSGCKKDVHMHTSYYTVQAYNPNPSYNYEGWLSDDKLGYLYASFENEDITPDLIENGCVLAYFIDSDGRDNPLPYEVFYQYDNSYSYYSDTFTYDVESVAGKTGIITFKFQTSDLENTTSIAKWGNVSFKVCVLEN